MSWVYKFDERALRELRKLDKQTQRELIAYLDQRIVGDADPRRFGKALKADWSGVWRYRVGNYRIICRIQDQELIVLVIAIGHRRQIYDS